MLRTLAIALVTVVLAAAPTLAVTSQEKMETCKVGAESQQLAGAKRSAFIKKCMAQGNYEPAARKNAKKTSAPPNQMSAPPPTQQYPQ
jgi:psiF repeat-containing protein